MRRVDPIVLIATGNVETASRRSTGCSNSSALPATGRFHLPVGPFADQQIGIDRDGDAFELARLFESFEELAKRSISH